MSIITIKKTSASFLEAVKREIKENHKKGFPVYQIKGGYIVAIYPNGRETILQKALVTNPVSEKSL